MDGGAWWVAVHAVAKSRTQPSLDAEAEAPILCLPDVKSWFIEKDPEAGKDWEQEKKGVTEGEMVR